METTFRIMRSLEHDDALVRMMQSLYKEDQAAHPVDHARFPATVRHLLANPAAGQIVLFHADETLAGYALLIPYWSNEFGGVLLFIDELYVSPQFRGRGIATEFLRSLGQQPPFSAVALALEVTPANRRANHLYQSLGFEPRSNAVLIRSLAKKAS